MRERIGSYRIEKVLSAEGGMGLVYKGRHDSLGRDAAIKTLLPKYLGDAAMRQRLLREAQAQARLSHPKIVAVYDLIEETDELFIAMELVEGGTLEAMLRARPRGRVSLDEGLPLFEQILEALAYVHSEKIVHRDVKPSNVMVCGGGVKLADFGIALLDEMPRLTSSRRVIGSPPYMSPEQIEGKSVDHRSDIYSAALVLYRMLAGRPPYEATEYLAQIHERMVGAPDLRTLVPELPPGVCDAIAIALRYDREQRFRFVAAFRDALREGAAGFFVSEPQPVDDDIAADAMTEPLFVPSPEPEAEPQRATAIVSIVIAAAFVAAISVIVTRFDRQSFPVTVPTQSAAAATPAPLPIIIEPAPHPVLPPVPAERRGAAPQEPKSEPFVAAKHESPEDQEAKRRREIDGLREAIGRGLTRAEEELGAENFAAAIEDIDRIAAMAQRHPEDLWQERDAIARLRRRVLDAQVAAEMDRAQNALLASRLERVEEDLRAEHWPEAERFAADIAKDPRASEAIVARANTLLQQAKEGRKNAFKDTQLGPTTNTVRKPSSPPRKER